MRRRIQDERGAVIVLFAAMMVAMLGLSAIVVDLSHGKPAQRRRQLRGLADGGRREDERRRRAIVHAQAAQSAQHLLARGPLRVRIAD